MTQTQQEEDAIVASMNQSPDLSCMAVDALVALMLACHLSGDASDKKFAEACRIEIARRKP